LLQSLDRWRVNLILKIYLCYNLIMIRSSLPAKAREVVIQDAIQRDMTTARRSALLNLLWNERYLTREQLVARVELKLGKNCFGRSAWKDTFYRDMRVVKRAFHAAGYQLAFSRSKHRRGSSDGYYLVGQPPISPQLKKILTGISSEVDPRQIEIYRRLSPADRFRQGCAVSDAARKVVSSRIRQQNPEMSLAEANRLALQRAYSP
jgi:hypothetical protein